MYLIVRLLIASIVFGSSLATVIWFKNHASARDTGTAKSMPLTQEADCEEVLSEFGSTSEGATYYSHEYRCSDDWLSSTTEEHVSPAQALHALRLEIQNAEKILKLEQIGKGTQVETRVVAQFHGEASTTDSNSDRKHFAVLWTDQSRFNRVESSSLEQTLRLEKKFRGLCDFRRILIPPLLG
jgi:hypothetical protein